MIEGKKIVVVLPAYHAARTLERTIADLPHGVVDETLLVDDASSDDTVAVARRLGLRTIVHEKNLGYGGNQKTCYREALALGADIVVMLHPDYQYSPKLLGAMAHMVASGHYDVALGSRILGQSAIAGGMPIYKYFANRAPATFAQNVIMGQKALPEVSHRVPRLFSPGPRGLATVDLLRRLRLRQPAPLRRGPPRVQHR